MTQGVAVIEENRGEGHVISNFLMSLKKNSCILQMVLPGRQTVGCDLSKLFIVEIIFPSVYVG